MQAHWWYAKADQKLGPVPLEIIQQKLFQQEINAATLVWREGLASWLPLGEVDELAALLKSVPPELPSAAKASIAAEVRQAPSAPALPAATLASVEAKAPPAAPWKRALARFIDVSVLTFVLGFALNYIAVYFAENGSGLAMRWLEPGKGVTQAVMFLPLVLLLECWIYVGFGNTLGKAMLGLQVKTLQGGSLDFEQYFKRQCGVWWYGLGLGLPIINLITVGFWLSRLNGKGTARYDENRFVVTGQNINKDYWAFACLVLLVSSITYALLHAHAMKSQAEVKREIFIPELAPETETYKLFLEQKKPAYEILANDAEVKDLNTGLIWHRCSVGQSWDGKGCVGLPKIFTFDEAQKLNGRDWRVPNARELASLIDCSGTGRMRAANLADGGALIPHACAGDSVQATINSSFFPNTEPWPYWSSSPNVGNSNYAWLVYFGNGYVNNSGLRSFNLYVRMVRATQ